MANVQQLNFVMPDECCSAALTLELQAGKLEGKRTWTHDKCGQEWKAVAQLYNGEQHTVWVPNEEVIIFT